MNNLKTTEDLLNDRTLFTEQEANEIRFEVKQEVKRIRGGARVNAGRKKKSSENVLKFQVRVSEKEKNFLKYARSHNLDYDKLMEC